MLLAFAARGHIGVHVGLFCEDYPQLKDRHLSKINYEFPEWLGEYSSTDHNFVLFPEFGGGVIAFRNLDDASKYKSSEFAAIAIDELTSIDEDSFIFLRTRLRWPGISDTKFIGATNPGGKGHLWVKRLWIERSFADYEQEQDDFVYLQALLRDNPHINDPAYMKSLESQPEKRRQAFLDGDWDLYEGQFFDEWNKKVHIVASFEIPYSWHHYRSIDVSGKNGITSCHWYAVDSNSNVYVYREHYATGLNADEHAMRIAEMSGDEEYRYTMIDSSAMAQQGLGETMAQVYERHGVFGLMPSPKGPRISGWNSVRHYLQHNERTPPKLRVFPACTNLIRTLPSLIHDPNNVDDVDTHGEDHAADELRYLLHTLRDQGSPKPETLAERKLRELLEGRRNGERFNYQYRRN